MLTHSRNVRNAHASRNQSGVEADAEPGTRLGRVEAALRAEFGDPQVRPHGAPLDVLIGTILSQSTSGTNSSRAYESLRGAFPRWEDALAAGPVAIADAIRSGGLAAQKSVRIHALLRGIADAYGALSLDHICTWPDDRVFGWLGGFDGIGTKTIAVMLLFACGRDTCPVDTHVNRIARRLGFVREKAPPDETFRTLQRHLPTGRGASLHVNLIRFGRTRCRARSPRCEGCPLRSDCAYDGETGLRGG